MGDLISRNEAIKEFAEKREVWYGKGPLPSMESLMWQGAISITEQLPSVDAEPVVHGHWIETTIPANTTGYGGVGQDKKDGVLCSKCRSAFDVKLLWSNNYCPNCGAKMDEVTGNEP